MKIGSERESGVAITDQPVFIVTRQRADRSNNRRATRVSVAHYPKTAARGKAGVRRRRPRMATIDRKVDTQDGYAVGKRTVCVVARIAGLHVDVVVRARDEHIRM